MEEVIIMSQSIEDLEGYQPFKRFAGEALSIRQASGEFGIPHQTISRWVRKGYIRVIGKRGRATMIDKSHVAYYASLYHAQSAGGKPQGKWLIDKEGLPYKKRE